MTSKAKLRLNIVMFYCTVKGFILIRFLRLSSYLLAKVIPSWFQTAIYTRIHYIVSYNRFALNFITQHIYEFTSVLQTCNMSSMSLSSCNRAHSRKLTKSTPDILSSSLAVWCLFFYFSVSIKLSNLLLNFSWITDTEALIARTTYKVCKLLIAL